MSRKKYNAEMAALPGGIALFLVLCLDGGAAFKAVTMVLALSGVAVMLWKRKVIARRFGLIAAMLTAYCVMITVSGFYAPVGKFALNEALKNILALALFLLVLGLEPERGERSGRCCATGVELASALVSILSIELSSTNVLTRRLFELLSPVSGLLSAIDSLVESRLKTIFGNVNIFSGIAGLGILVGLALLAAAEDRRERRLHLVCLAVNATAFVCAFSRGAMAAIAVAFLAYLFFARGEARARALVVMAEALLFAGAAAVVGILTQFGETEEGGHPALLAATLAAAAALVLFDRFVGNRLSETLSRHAKTTTIVLGCVLCIGALCGAAAVMLTGPAYVQGENQITRAAYPEAGEHTLRVEADGNANVNVYYVPRLESFSGISLSLTEGEADGLTFTVPEDAGVVFFRFRSDDGATITNARYDGASSGEIKLSYRLLPEGIASFLQGSFHSESFLLRRMQWATALRLWRECPIIGLGVGSFECRGLSAMPFYFETKYVHSHYLQTLLDMGVVGLALFLGLLAACAFVLVRAGKKETRHPMIPALGACLVFLSLQAVTDVIFSSGYYLPVVFPVFALMSVCTEDVLPVKWGEKAKKWLPRATLALLSAWIVLLGLNLYARALFKNPTYDGLVTAEKIDWFERQDYMISYASAAVKMEDCPEEITQKMYAYLGELEDANAYAVHYYAAECYFELGETEKAIEQLVRYVNAAANDRSVWNTAFAMVSQYNDGRAEFAEGAETLYRSLQTWNEQAVVPVVLDDAVQEYIEKTLKK